MAFHLETFVASGSRALIFDIHRESMGNRLVVGFDVDRIDPCDDSGEKEEKCG